MKLTFIADVRSPTSRQWIRAFVDRGDDVHVISSYPVDADILPGAQMSVVPLVLGRNVSPRVKQFATPERAFDVRSLIGPTMVRFRRSRLQALVDEHQPDLIHAMRIPFEGMAAAWLTGRPIVVSVWGLDFTMCAPRNRSMAAATRLSLQRCAALHCDCHRDARLALKWGLPPDRPVWVFPGNGGVDESIFSPGDSRLHAALGIPPGASILVNPRGIREYVGNDAFFSCLPSIMSQLPEVHVVCPGMAGGARAEGFVEANGLAKRVHLLPLLPHHEMADVFRAARVSASLSSHDGTPNTLLEAMACGALPVVGDVESVREWVTHQDNGLVVDPNDGVAVVEAFLRALTDDKLVAQARRRNEAVISERASYRDTIEKMAENYASLVGNSRARTSHSPLPSARRR